MSDQFRERVRNIIQKILSNISLVKTIQCRNSYERRIVHTMAEEHGIEHKKIFLKSKQKKRVVSTYDKNGRRIFCWRQWNVEEYYDDVYGVKLSSPISVRREPEARKKLAREILREVLIDDVAKIVCQKI